MCVCICIHHTCTCMNVNTYVQNFDIYYALAQNKKPLSLYLSMYNYARIYIRIYMHTPNKATKMHLQRVRHLFCIVCICIHMHEYDHT